MKSTTTLLFIILFSVTIHAQRLYFESGLSNARFENYTNAEGENTLTNNYANPLKPNFGAGILINAFAIPKHYESGFGGQVKWDSGLKYYTYLINSSVKTGTNNSEPISYELNYIALKTGVNASFLSLPFIRFYSITFQLHAHVSNDWLVYGKREFRGDVVDLKKDNEFYKSLLNYHFGGDIDFIFSETISFYANYDMKRSFKKNNPKNNEEYYQIYANAVNIGIRINIGSIYN